MWIIYVLDSCRKDRENYFFLNLKSKFILDILHDFSFLFPLSV